MGIESFGSHVLVAANGVPLNNDAGQYGLVLLTMDSEDGLAKPATWSLECETDMNWRQHDWRLLSASSTGAVYLCNRKEVFVLE